MTPRLPAFARMGEAFSRRLGNIRASFRIAGTVGDPVAVIVRQTREPGEVEEFGQSVEAVSQSVSVAAALVPGLQSQRDAMIIAANIYPIRNISDDGRAMLRLTIEGDLP